MIKTRELIQTAGEVISRSLVSLDTSIKSNVSSVHCAENTVLETRWVLEVDIQLAILSALSNCDARANGRNVIVENEGETLNIHTWSVSLPLSDVVWRTYVERSEEM